MPIRSAYSVVRVEDATPAALPDLLPGAHSCTRCYANRECMMYAASALNSKSLRDESIIQTHGDLLTQFTGHISMEDIEYFTEWDRLIDLEADATQSQIAKSWLIESETRERETAKCISSVVFDSSGSVKKASSGDSQDYAILSFRRSEQSKLQTPLSNLALEPGCHVVVSADQTLAFNSRRGVPLPRMHIVRGFLHQAFDNHVQVRASGDDLARMQQLVQQRGASAQLDGPMLFRLDRDDMATGTGTLRQNLINFCTGDQRRSQQEGGQEPLWAGRLVALRELVIRLRPPCFVPDVSNLLFNPSPTDNRPVPTLPGCDLMDLALEFAELNRHQAAAAEKVSWPKTYLPLGRVSQLTSYCIVSTLYRLSFFHFIR